MTSHTKPLDYLKLYSVGQKDAEKDTCSLLKGLKQPSHLSYLVFRLYQTKTPTLSGLVAKLN